MSIVTLVVVAVLIAFYSPAKVIASIAVFLLIYIYPVASLTTLFVVSGIIYYFKRRKI